MSFVHPPKNQLIAFGQGKLAAEESSQVEQHLESCHECCETLHDLQDDTFIGLVRVANVAEASPVQENAAPDAKDVTEANAGESARPASHESEHAATFLVPLNEPLGPQEVPPELAEHPRYHIEELIGKGGMGNVYRAEHRLMNRPVAIKVINAQLMRHPLAVERFRREVRAAAKLAHPNIVAAYDAEQAGNAHFLVMEFVEGTDLASVVKNQGPTSVAVACECIRQVANGLQHAHEKGMVHRDIKPHNLMFAAGGQIRILDFGLAGFASESAFESGSVTVRQEGQTTSGGVSGGQASETKPVESHNRQSGRAATGQVEATDAHLTMMGSMMGTPDYMAPEQAVDAHSADIRADIYSLGCTLHFLLTGKPPFADAGSVVDILKAHAERAPTALTTLRNDVPTEVANIVTKMLAKIPAERFQIPAEVAEVLAPIAKPAMPPTRRRVRTLVAAAALFALLAGVIFVQTSKGRVEIQSEVDDVEVVIMQGGAQIDVIDITTGSQVTRLPSGEYEIKLKGDRNDVEIKGGDFTLSRWGKAIVTLKRKPEGLAADPPLKSNVDAQKPASHKLSAGWGDFINTDGASDVRESDGRVTITVPAGDRTYWSKQGPGSVPRLMQEVDGDFVAQVKVTLGRDSDKSHLFSASLAVWNNDRDFYTLTFTLYASNDNLSAMRFLDGPRGVTSSGTSGKSRIAHLKIERRNTELWTSWSRDGETWEKTKEPVIVNWPRKVQVGVAVNNRSTDELSVQFEGLTITKDTPSPAIVPFDAEQAKRHQEAWAKHLGVPVEYTNSLGMKFRLIPPGEFTMGSPSEEIDRLLTEAHDWQRTSLESERPQRQVRIPGPLFMGQFEVTVGQFKLFIAETGHKTTAETNGTGGFVFEGDKTDSKPDFTWRRAADAPSDNHPVVQISLPDAQAFCAWLSKKEGRTYAVPQDEQWEYACRAGTTSRWYCGDVEEPVREIAWISPHAGYPTHAVGGKQPNAFGLFDMLGNAEEFCVARGGAVSRGGHIGHLEKGVRSATRNYLGDYPTWYLRGFRVSIVGDLKGQSPPPAIAPFDAEHAKKHQAAWAQHLGVPVEYTNSIGMKFVLIPPGEFTMGSTPDEIEEALRAAGDAEDDNTKFHKNMAKSEGPQHQVILTQPYYLGVFEVTQTNYETVMGQNPAHFSAMGAGKDAVAGIDTAKHPVEMVNWNDAAEFCMKLSQQEDLQLAYLFNGPTVTTLKGNGYRLPTEAQWEFACRAGTTVKFWFGDQDEHAHQAAWIHTNSGGRTHRVGELQENPFGLHDTNGNVCEWCQDVWELTEYDRYREQAATDPIGPVNGGADALRVLRSNCLNFSASACRASFRHMAGQYGRFSNTGFRVVLSVAAVRQMLEESRKPVAMPVAANRFERDQKAAEWILRIGGSVRVNIDGVERLAAKLDELPTGDWQIVEICVWPAQFNATAKLDKLAGLQQLRWLRLFNCQISDAGLQHLTDVPNLAFLDLDYNYGSTDAALKHIGQNFPSLTHLAIHGTSTTDEGLAHLAPLKSLRVLNLSATRLTGSGLVHLAPLGSLTELYLSWTAITDESLTHLAQFPELAVLGLRHTSVTDAGMPHLVRIAKLRTLDLRESKISSAGLDQVRKAFPNANIEAFTADQQKEFWEQAVKSVTWTPLEPTMLTADAGETFRRLDDSSVLVEGPNPAQARYTIVARTSLKRVTALRLDVLRDDKLPSKGPGRHPNGTFVLTGADIRFQAALDGPGKNVSVRRAFADYTQNSHDVSLIANAGRGSWAIWRDSEPMQNQSLVLDLAEPLVVGQGSTISITLRHESIWHGANLGRFRLSVTDADRPPVDKTNTTAAEPKSPVLSPPSIPVGQNLLTDPSFEDTPLTQLPRDWRAWLNDGPEFRCEVVAGGHTGQRCLKISGKGTRGVVFANDLKADRSKRSALKGWVKFEGDKDARAVIKLNYFRGSEFLGVHDLVGATADQPGWHMFEKTDALDAYPTADHFYAMCHVEGSGTGWFDDLELVAYDRDKLPADFDARYGRHNRLHGPNSLQRWVGTWDMEFGIREIDNSQTEFKLPMTMVSERTLGDYFLMTFATSQPVKRSDPQEIDHHERLTFLMFDQNLGAFRQWIFNSNGIAIEGRGPWNNEKQTLELRMLPDASNLHASEHFVDADHIAAHLRLQYVMGQRDAGHWTATRKAVDGKVNVPTTETHGAEPPELSQLNKFAGEWTIRAKYKPSAWNPQPREETIRETSDWILGGRFMMTRAFNEKDELTSIWIATYEPSEKSNRFWFFNADGSSGEWRLTWDEASSGFQFRAIDMPSGWIGTGVNRWVNEDSFDNEALIKDETGRVLLDMTQKRRRKK